MKIFITFDTPKHKLKINYLYRFINRDKLIIRKRLFQEMCKQGCPNYENKYTCPPYSPSFRDHLPEYKKLLILLMYLKLNQFKHSAYQPYLKIRISNSILKSRIEKIMRNLETKFDSKFLGTGACRLCRSCELKRNKPCKHPKDKRFSLESLGVDCNHLTKLAFGKELLWYKKDSSPKYTSVICALPLKESISRKLILEELDNEIRLIDKSS